MNSEAVSNTKSNIAMIMEHLEARFLEDRLICEKDIFNEILLIIGRIFRNKLRRSYHSCPMCTSTCIITSRGTHQTNNFDV